MALITQIIEPLRLLLSWQKPDGDSPSYNAGGRRYIIGELTRGSEKSSDISLRYFTNDQDFIDAKTQGFEGYPAFNIETDIHSHDVMAAFSRRVPAKARGDYNEFLAYWRIAEVAGRNITPFALLGYTGGALPSDGFNLLHTFEETQPPCEFVIEITGVRHNPEAVKMIEDQTLNKKKVNFVFEPENPHDFNAIRVEVQGIKIGYIKRGQAAFFMRWLGKAKFNAHVERVNGRKR